MSESNTVVVEKASRTKKTPEGQDWVKRNLKKDVSDGSGTGGAAPAKRDFRSQFETMKRQSPYKDFPDKLKSSLAGPVEQVLSSVDEQSHSSALETFSRSVQSAWNAKFSWEMASANLGALEDQVASLEAWKAPAADALRGRVTTVMNRAAEWDFAGALKEMEGIRPDVRAAMQSHYEQGRKALEKIEADAKSLGDDPASSKALRKTYLASAKVVDDYVARQQYQSAIENLPKLAKAAAAAAAAGGGEGSAAKPPDAKKLDLKAEFEKIKAQSPFKDFPDRLKTSLAAPVVALLQSKDELAQSSALETFKKDVQSASKAKSEWGMAAASVAALDTQVKHLERWRTSKAGGIRGRLTAMTDKANAGDYGTALQDMRALLKDVPAGIKSSYEFRRKQLETLEAEANQVGDDPAYVGTLRQTYVASAKVADDFVAATKFVEAIDALPKLEKDAKAALIGAERAETEQQTKTKCADIKNDLNAQIKFRRKGDLRKKDTDVRDAVGSPEWKAAVKKIVETKLDDEFMAQFNKSADEVADALSKNPKIKEAYVKWGAWTSDFTANKAKIQEAMQEVLKVQSESLGWPTPAAKPYSAKDGNCGQYDGNPYPPGTLEVNFRGNDAKDFREILDTLTHENTHAYQEKLIRGFKDGSIKAGDLEYSAAMVLEMNDTRGTRGYVNGKASGSYDKTDKDAAYMKQPCEAHAWSAGSRVGRAAYKKLKRG